MDWHYPGYTLGMQRLTGRGSQRFDVLTLLSEADDVRVVYFDVTEFFGVS